MKIMMTERETKETTMAVVVTMVLAIIIVLLAIFFFSKTAHGEETKVITGSFIVSGYRSGEFAIKEEPEETLNKGVSSVKARMKIFSGQLQLQFVCVGSADATGVSVANDELAAKRAKQVESVLSANFSDAKVVSWSRGDAENVRRVKVEYKIILILSPAPAIPEKVVAEKVAEKKEDRSSPYLKIALFIAAIIFVFLASSITIRKRPKKLTETLEVNGCKVKVQVKGKFYYSPFTSRSRNQICRDSKKGIVDSLKGCLKEGTEFEKQKQELIKKGVIIQQ